MKKETNAQIHDYSEGAAETVILTVRKHNTYGKAKAGEKIIVSLAESLNSSTKSACMTEVEKMAAAAERARKAKSKAKKPERTVKAIVEAGLARLGNRP